MAKLSQIKERNSKIEKGAWVSDLPNLGGLGISVKVRGYGNTAHMRAIADEYGDLSKEQRENPELRTEIDGRIIAKTILLDWAGIDDMKYTPENVKKVMTDPDLTLLRAGIDWASKTVSENGRDKLEADAKN